MHVGLMLPNVTFKYRIRTDNKPITYVDKTNGDANPFEWQDITTEDLFKSKRCVIFSLPGAFTPTCSTMQVPGFENNCSKIKSLGIDNVYVISVNDTFVMRKWMIDQGCVNIDFIPDGNGEFTQRMGMLVPKTHLGFGHRSWRYAAVVDDCVIEHWLEEPGINNHGEDDDPYVNTTPENIIRYLKSVNKKHMWEI